MRNILHLTQIAFSDYVRNVKILQIIFGVGLLTCNVVNVFSQAPPPFLARPAETPSATTMTARVASPITNLQTMKAFLQKDKFTIPASILPMRGDVLLSGERSSVYIPDIYLSVDARGANEQIECVNCTWWATFMKTPDDGKRTGQSIGEWRQAISDLIGGNADRTDEWIGKCIMRWVAAAKGEMIKEKTEIDGIKYEFSGSKETAMMSVSIIPHAH